MQTVNKQPHKQSHTIVAPLRQAEGPEQGPYADNILNSPRKRLVALSLQLRKKRMAFFQSLIASLPRPLSILDVGGTQLFWNSMESLDEQVQITLYNLERFEVTLPNIISVTGDARDMQMFTDQSFDVVFSNSVIDHLGSYEQQQRMAQEVQRVGKRYFVQVPNRYFPIEPHFLLPGVQFLPMKLRIWLIEHINGWGKAYTITDKQIADKFVRGIRLMSEKELKSLFPGAQIYQEKFLGLTKSFIVYKGWESKYSSLEKRLSMERIIVTAHPQNK